MKTNLDLEADAFYARFVPAGRTIAETREVAPGVVLDLDESGQLVGLEVLGIAARAAGRYATRSVADAAE